MLNILKKLDIALTNVFFSKIWLLVDFLVCINIVVYCCNYNIAVNTNVDCNVGISTVSAIMYFIYLLVCENIRLNCRLNYIKSKLNSVISLQCNHDCENCEHYKLVPYRFICALDLDEIKDDYNEDWEE